VAGREGLENGRLNQGRHREPFYSAEAVYNGDVTDERETLREANNGFYRALEVLDLEALDALWLHEGWVRCVHPGWDVLVGWEAVKESYEQIVAGTRWMRVTPTAVQLQVFGDVGLVACTENITSASGGEVGLAVAQATNLFKKVGGEWRLFHHHASPAPVYVTQPFSGTVQ
jgi:ketosteroid isomerase-like protein